MISFRFFLVSLIAVFLALAVGIVVGTTLVDRAVVSGLRNRVDSVSENLDERQADNDELREEVARLDDYTDAADLYLVQGRLEGRLVVVVADEGVPDEPVDAVRALVDVAGGEVRGTVRLDESWSLTEADQREAFAEVTGTSLQGPSAMRAEASQLLVSDLSSEAGVVGDEAGPVEQMASIGMIGYESSSDAVAEPDSPVLFVFVTGTDSVFADSAHLTDLAGDALRTDGAVVVAEVYERESAPEGEERGDRLAVIRGDEELTVTVATVDSLDLPEGPSTTVLTLAVAADGQVGAYGYGNGAEAPLPPFEPTP